MRSVADLAIAAIGRVPTGTTAPNHVGVSKLPLMHDTCSCIKEAGCCGRDGIHFQPFGRRDIEREIDRALAGLPQGATETEREQVENSARQWAGQYVGQMVAYEHCPAYITAARAKATAKTAAGWSDDL